MATKFVFEPTNINQLKSAYDIIIIGSGSAGLTAAFEAHKLGKNPVVLEKMPTLGGDTKRASSGMNAAETFVQKEHGIKDSIQNFYDETFVGGGKTNDQDLLKYFTANGADAIKWLADEGIKLDDLTTTGGMSVPRAHRPSSTAPVGAFLVSGLLKRIADEQIPVFTGVTVTKLNEADGRISGVTITTENGEATINAPAVILATGGYGASPKLLKKYRPDLVKYKTTNQPGNTGDGIYLAEQVGAKLVDMDQVQVHPTVQQDTDHVYLIGETVRGEGAILVNHAGQRFVDELTTRDRVTAAINQLDEGGAYLIFDQGIRDRVKAIDFYDHVGLVKSGETLAELAATTGLQPDNLKKTVSDWNKAVISKQDSKFGRTTGMNREIDHGPYFSIHIAPAVHYTMGGVKATPQTQVVNSDGNIIGGLFAAGEVVGGLHGNNRIGGNSIAETVVFGLQAGRQAAKYIK
ncbi:flavocytochrome c [Lentilactobacillus sp. IMAU92037]|uniref:flavocytochrome c n=1 Tax=Lentilactobacillus dabitei TaxID=2831523 RepID=UPI001C2C5EAE|nr:flavocytochrome c [Lentilactobacillus dabitei]MBV0930875.1 flavocytochrome c [Lentilactobacillus dabitei]